jgi:hypothetical protein
MNARLKDLIVEAEAKLGPDGQNRLAEIVQENWDHTGRDQSRLPASTSKSRAGSFKWSACRAPSQIASARRWRLMPSGCFDAFAPPSARWGFGRPSGR